MKTRLTSFLTAIFVVAMGLQGTPALAGPSVSLNIQGFFHAVSTGTLFFDGELELPDGVAEVMNDAAGNGYGAILGLHYEITVDDPSPTTPRDWLLALDPVFNVGIQLQDAGTVLLDQTDFGITGPLTGIPITDLTGPFSVNDLAMLGMSIFDNLLSPCAGPPAASTSFATCLYLEGPGGRLSGDLFAGLTPDFTDMLLDDLGSLLSEDISRVAGMFDIEATLTTTAVSEPGTFAVLGLGLAAIGFLRRRQTFC